MSNIDHAKAIYDAFGRGDIPAVLGGMDANVQWSEAEGNPYEPSGKPWSGPDAVLQNLFMKLGADWEYFKVLPSRFYDAGDTVVVELRYDAKHKETGKHLDAQVCHLLDFRDAKLTRFQQYVDTAQLQDAMGAR